MSVTEFERNQLFTWFEEHMGKDRATTLMSLLPPVGWADVATKRDLDVLAERLDTKIDTLGDRLDTKIDTVAEHLDAKIDTVGDHLDAKIDTVGDRLDTKFVGLDTKVSGRIDGLEARMATKDDLHELRSDLQRTFVTWIFAAQGAVVAAVGAMLVLIR